MPRVKLISDQEVFVIIRRLIGTSGDKAATFGAVSRATGLAGATLVQRFGTQDGMVRAALLSAWDDLDAQTALAEATADLTPKGAQALLKSLTPTTDAGGEPSLLAADFRDPALRARAGQWRERVELALALRFGGGSKGQEVAAIVFSAWQGQLLWTMVGGKSFRLKDVIKRLT